MVAVQIPAQLGQEQLIRRAKQIRIVLTDCDGCLTDTGVYYGKEGEQLKRFSIRDGMGVERLRGHGIETAILTGEASPSVEHRSIKLRMPYYFPGIRDKLTHLAVIQEQTGYSRSQMAFLGDDVNDLALLEAIGEQGLTGTPADGVQEVRNAVHHVGSIGGGHGAFREFAEWILKWRLKAKTQAP